MQIDNRITNIGNIVLITGTLLSTDYNTTIDFSSHVKKILSFNIVPTNFDFTAPERINIGLWDVENEDVENGHVVLNDVVMKVSDSSIILYGGGPVALFNHKFTLIGRR